MTTTWLSTSTKSTLEITQMPTATLNFNLINSDNKCKICLSALSSQQLSNDKDCNFLCSSSSSKIISNPTLKKITIPTTQPMNSNQQNKEQVLKLMECMDTCQQQVKWTWSQCVDQCQNKDRVGKINIDNKADTELINSTKNKNLTSSNGSIIKETNYTMDRAEALNNNDSDNSSSLDLSPTQDSDNTNRSLSSSAISLNWKWYGWCFLSCYLFSYYLI